MATAIDLFEHYDETNQLRRVDQFTALEQDAPARLTDFEFAKLDDLRDDIVWLQERDRRDRADRASWLGREYRRFETWWGRPGSWLRGLEPPAGPPPPVPPPGAFDAEYQLLDQLSLWYGGQYRGAIVFNYRNALIGGVAALAAHTWADVELLFSLVEILLFVLVFGFYAVGRTPQPAFRGTSRQRPLIARRWHQRWLEYRLLAERFRYAGLLAPFDTPGVDPKDALAHAWQEVMGDDRTTPVTWQDRFFLWRLRSAPRVITPPQAWFDRLLAIMRYQAWYHDQAGARRHNAVRRLHAIAVVAVVAAFVLLTIRVMIVAYEHRVFGELGFGETLIRCAAAISFAGGWCTVLAASVHGMLSTVELERLSTSSRETAQRIVELHSSIEARRAAGAAPADVRAETEAFCRLVTEEASGWRSLLRDKDVPVPH